jgi:hypothetical protein
MFEVSKKGGGIVMMTTGFVRTDVNTVPAPNTEVSVYQQLIT